MRHAILCLCLAMLAAGCGGGGVEDDLETSGDDLRKKAAKMSDADLERKMNEIEKYAKEMESKYGDDHEPNQAEMEKAVKLMEVTGIYGAELMKRKMK